MLLLCCTALYLYDLFAPAQERFLLYTLQFVEAGVLIFYGIVFLPLYVRAIKSVFLHATSFMLFFILFSSVKYEYDHWLFIFFHSLCYLYFHAITYTAALVLFKRKAV